MTNKKVAIYSTPTCHFCHEAKDFFQEKGVQYEDYNVMTDLEKRKEMVTKSGQMGVPVIVVTDESGKDEIVIGFDEPTLTQLLGL